MHSVELADMLIGAIDQLFVGVLPYAPLPTGMVSTHIYRTSTHIYP